MEDFLSVSAVDVKEGFLCPICMNDLGDVSRLHQHFEENHADEDRNTLSKFKEIFGKTKILGKILNKEDDAQLTTLSPNNSFSALASAVGSEAKALFNPSGAPHHVDVDPVSGVRTNVRINPPKPKASSVVNHTRDFKAERRKKLDRNKSVNQVLIRLEKLMRDVPSDPSKRRAHERAAVAWIDEDQVKLCPTCARAFNLKRRKHHCRLCGSVLCGDCSTAVSFELAKRVLNPASVATFDGQAEADKGKKSDGYPPPQGGMKALFGGKLAGSHESLNALANLMEQKMVENQFRSCHLCLSILEGLDRRAVEALAAVDSQIVQLFLKLKELQEEGTKQALEYKTAVDSLNNGEEEFSVSDVKQHRMRLAIIAEQIAVVGKHIRGYGVDGEAEAPSAARLQIQRNLSQDAVNFVKATLVALPDAPTEDEFDRLRMQRVRDAENRVEEEKKAAKLSKLKAEQAELRRNRSALPQSRSTASVRPESSAVQHGEGLVLSSSASALTSSDDPLVQQIRNLHEFIRQARRLGRADEVAALEENLQALQTEFRRAQKERTELEENFNDFKGLFHKHSPAKVAPEHGGAAEAAESSPSCGDGRDESRAEPQEYVDMDEYDASGKNPFLDD